MNYSYKQNCDRIFKLELATYEESCNIFSSFFDALKKK